VRGMSRLPGRKLCLLVSDGFLDGSGTRESRSIDLRRVLDAATRSGTVVYSLDTRGLVTGSADAGTVGTSSVMPGLQSRVDRQVEELLRDTLTTLADGTGGFLVRGTDLAGGLRRMLEDNETYYLLAYEPTNTQRDGRFRKIEVRLRGRAGLDARTRKGYFAPDAKAEAARSRAAAGTATTAAPLAPAEALTALAAPMAAGGIPVVLSAGFASLPPAGSQVLVRAHVDLAGVRWQHAGGRHRADLELVGGVFDAGGQPVGAPFGRRAELDVAVSELERARAAGLSYQQWIPLPPGRYEVRMLARERSLAQQGGATEHVDVPDLGHKKLALSAVFLSSPSPEAAAAAAAAAGRFKRGDSVSFQFYVYNAAVDGGATDLVYQAQVWSAGKAIAASRPQPARMQEKDGVPVAETNSLGLEGLAAGAYELRVVVDDRKARTTTLRRVPFTIH